MFLQSRSERPRGKREVYSSAAMGETRMPAHRNVHAARTTCDLLVTSATGCLLSPSREAQASALSRVLRLCSSTTTFDQAIPESTRKSPMTEASDRLVAVRLEAPPV